MDFPASSSVNVVSHLDPRFGGMSTSLPRFCQETQVAAGRGVSLVGFCEPGEQPAITGEDIQIIDLPRGRLRWWLSESLKNGLKDIFSHSDTIHIHGLWDEHCEISASLARALRKPYIISAHGMMEPWALNNSRLKKRLYSSLIERRNLQSAKCLRALTRSEVDDYRAFGLQVPVVVIPNGVDVPEAANDQAFFRAYPELQGKRLVLFLGRLHHKKGVRLLCEAWRTVSAQYRDAHLVLAGPAAPDEFRKLEDNLNSCGLKDRVTFTGMLSGDLKWSALAAAYVFVLPSYSEGFSVAILEALGMGLPVIISNQCHLDQVLKEECGWAVKPNAHDVENALRECLSASASDMQGYANRAKQFVQREYRWPAIGLAMHSVYQWMQGGALPKDVEVFNS